MSEYDVVVVGSGAAGMTAAITAAQNGLKTVVLEKAPVFGGTTAFSGGYAWIPANHHMAGQGMADSTELVTTYLKGVLGNYYDQAKISAFVANAAPMLQHLESTTSVKFTPSGLPDYYPDLPGAAAGRSLPGQEFDGRELGADLKLLRRPREELTIFGGLQLSAADITHLRKSGRSIKSFLHAANLLSRYALQRLAHGQCTRLVNGNAVAGRLLKSARDAGVELRNNSPVTRGLCDGGRVTGVVIAADGVEQIIRARHGVVLATGGFGSNEDLRRQFMPFPDEHISLQPKENVGDGIRLGQGLGGVINRENPVNGIWTPVSTAKRKDGSLATFPHIMADRYMPGSTVVDLTGKRFTNEADSYQSVVNAMHRLSMSKAYLIGDHRFVRTYGMGMARPAPYPLGKWERSGYLISAPTIGALAAKIGIDAENLVRTIADFNRYAAQGEDPEFGRGSDVLSRFRGDPENQPNPSLGPIDRAPYYALQISVGDLSSVAGLECDEHARVLDETGGIINGLYAAGLDMNSVTRGLYPGGGASIGPAMTFGYIAANHIVGQAKANSVVK